MAAFRSEHENIAKQCVENGAVGGRIPQKSMDGTWKRIGSIVSVLA